MSYNSALNKINAVKNEVNDGANTADRVGDAMRESLYFSKEETDKKPDTVNIADYMTEGAEIPLGAVYNYYGNPTHTLAGYCNETDDNFIAVCIYHWENSHSIVLYVKNVLNKYIYTSSFRSDQAATDLEKHVAGLFGGTPVTYEQDGNMTAEDKITFDEMVIEVFPLTVNVVTTNAGTREIGDDVTPNIVLSITRKGVDVPAADITQSISPTPAYISPDKRTISGYQLSSGSTTYQVAVTQGGQTKSIPNQVFNFMNYRYYGELTTATEPSAAQIKSMCEGGTLSKQLSNSTVINTATPLGANHCYVFVVPNTSVNLIVRNANSGNPITGCTTGTVTIRRSNGTADVNCKYVIVPASPVSWNFIITNS